MRQVLSLCLCFLAVGLLPVGCKTQDAEIDTSPAYNSAQSAAVSSIARWGELVRSTARLLKQKHGDDPQGLARYGPVKSNLSGWVLVLTTEISAGRDPSSKNHQDKAEAARDAARSFLIYAYSKLGVNEETIREVLKLPSDYQFKKEGAAAAADPVGQAVYGFVRGLGDTGIAAWQAYQDEIRKRKKWTEEQRKMRRDELINRIRQGTSLPDWDKL